jgi:NAD+ synthase (glutamine-hydrolysing)
MTYFGDSESHYHVNMGLPKTIIKPLVLWLGTRPEFATASASIHDICDTPVSPELIPPDAKGRIQSTEETVGPYLLQDFFLYWAIRKQLPPLHVLLYATSAFEGKYELIELLDQLTSFYKRNSSPDGVKIGSMSLSQRADWRMPSDASASLWTWELEEFRELRGHDVCRD